MPRKYRPPAARRRKTKRPAPYFVEPLAEDGAVSATSPEETVPTTERLEEPSVTSVGTKAPARAGDHAASAAVRHILRDYSYVRAEVKRIVLVAGFLIVSLIITALLRN